MDTPSEDEEECDDETRQPRVQAEANPWRR